MLEGLLIFIEMKDLDLKTLEELRDYEQKLEKQGRIMSIVAIIFSLIAVIINFIVILL